MLAAVILLGSLAGGASASFGFLLDDWGVVPFSSWQPSLGTVATNVTDDVMNNDDSYLNVPSYPPISHDERYDLEALYAQASTATLNLAMVTSYNWQEPATDWWIQNYNLAELYSGAPVSGTTWKGADPAWNRAVTISLGFGTTAGGAPDGWSYAARLWNDRAELWQVPMLAATDTTHLWFPDEPYYSRSGPPYTSDPNAIWEGGVWYATADPVGFRGGDPDNQNANAPILRETVSLGDTYSKGFYLGGTNGLEQSTTLSDYTGNDRLNTWIYNVSFDVSGLNLVQDAEFWAHSAPWCGNDYLTIDGSNSGTVSYEPEPASLVLLGLCVVGAGSRLRRRKRSGV